MRGYIRVPEVSDYHNLVTYDSYKPEKGRTLRWPATITSAKINIDIEPRHNDVILTEVTSFRRLLGPTHK